MKRSIRPLLALAALAAAAHAQPEAWGPPFKVDGQGNVYHIDSFGRIAVNGSSTGWYPERDRGHFEVTRDGDVYYFDSFGRLCRNGAEVGQSWIRKGEFQLDGAGNLYTVKDWVDDEILRNGSETGYEIQKGSPFSVDDAGRVAYFDEATGKLEVDGVEVGEQFMPGMFKLAANGDVYWAQRLQHGTRLFRWKKSSGQHVFMSDLSRLDHFGFDAAGNLWYTDSALRVFKNGSPTGWRGFGFGLDAAGNLYTAFDDQIMKNGQPTGWTCRGHYDVAADGDVVHVVDPVRGKIARNGALLSFEVQAR